MPWWWRYFIPNLVTCISLVAGLLAVTLAVRGDLESSAWFILLSVLLDKLDGTVARLMQGASRFGLQMDSLTDLITFGVAPSVLMLVALFGPTPLAHFDLWPPLREVAYMSLFFFVIAAALRLAKFNILAEAARGEYFFGIPTTLCGAVVATSFLVAIKYPLLTRYVQLLPVLMLLLAFLMVSRVPLPKVRKGRTLLGNIWVFGNVVAIYACGLARIFPEYLAVMAYGYLILGAAKAMALGIKAPRLERPSATAAGLEGAELEARAEEDLEQDEP